MFKPPQLAFLCSLLDEVEKNNIKGSFAEIGCASGFTTLYLHKHLSFRGHTMRPYYCIDTFEGFTQEDAAYEYENRSKNHGLYSGMFAVNSQRWFNATMKANKLFNVTTIKTDAATCNYDTLGALAFCLLDIDLYKPTKAVLPLVYDRLAKGGILVVDDCDPKSYSFDGAHQAYSEFCKERGITPEIVEQKLGLLRK